MTPALRAELLKLRTTRLVAGMTSLAVALTALIGVLEAVTAGTGKGMAIPSLATAGGLRDNLTSTGFALLVAALLGVVIFRILWGFVGGCCTKNCNVGNLSNMILRRGTRSA